MSRLRVAYAGHDFFSSCLEEIISNPGLDFTLCLTGGPGEPPADNVMRLARECGAQVHTGRFSEETITAINEAELDLLVCAAYMHRIPIEKLSIGRAVNIHPTLLPHGRGPNPLPYLVSEHREFCGISIHEMTPELDRGPLLCQESVRPDEGDGCDELYLKLFAAAPRALAGLLGDLEGHFQRRREQESGSYWPEPSDQRRTSAVSTARVEEVLSLHSMFGMLGIIVEFNDATRVEVSRLTATRCEHAYQPGTVIAKLRYGWIVPVVDGLVRLESPRDLN